MLLYISVLLNILNRKCHFPPFLTTATEMFETPVLLNCYLRGCNGNIKEIRILIVGSIPGISHFKSLDSLPCSSKFSFLFQSIRAQVLSIQRSILTD